MTTSTPEHQAPWLLEALSRCGEDVPLHEIRSIIAIVEPMLRADERERGTPLDIAAYRTALRTKIVSGIPVYEDAAGTLVVSLKDVLAVFDGHE